MCTEGDRLVEVVRPMMVNGQEGQIKGVHTEVVVSATEVYHCYIHIINAQFPDNIDCTVNSQEGMNCWDTMEGVGGNVGIDTTLRV